MTTHVETVVLLDTCGTTQNPNSCTEGRNNEGDSLVKLGLFSIPKNEVTRIQHAIEIMVKFLLTSIYEIMFFGELVGSSKPIKRTLPFFETKPTIHYAFNDGDLLKVGSFYENTKIHYPDEFDFICVIAECDVKEYESMKDITAELSDIFHLCLREAALNPFPAGTCIEFVKYVRLHGPASRLEFSYKSSNGNGGNKSIFVDISPASKVHIQNSLPNDINVCYSEWKSIVLATGSFLLLKVFSAGHPKHETQTKVSITESEQQYMLEKMSEKHKQVYRLLKYILNNESMGEELRELIRSEENQTSVVCCRIFHPRVVYDFPSYVIKTLMFHHCQDCNKCVETISDCYVSVLNSILKLFKTEQKHKVLCFWRKETSFSVSVETMTGETIEISDNYESSLKIKKYLKEIRNGIVNGSTSDIIQTTEQRPLAQKMVKVIQNHRKKRQKRKTCTAMSTGLAMYCMGFMLVLALLVSLGIIASTDFERRLCWNGTSYIEGVNYTYSDYSNPSDLNLFNMSAIPISIHRPSTEAMLVRHIYCFEYDYSVVLDERETKSWANISRVYYCSDKNACTGTKLLDSKIFSNNFDQEHKCNRHDYEEMFESKDPNSSYMHISPNGKQLTCWQIKADCLDMVKRHYLFARISSENKQKCSTHQNCLPTFFTYAKQLSCYESKHFNESATTTDTEICCCDKNPCADPELDRESKLSGYILGFLVAFSFILILSLCTFGTSCVQARCAYRKHSDKGKHSEQTFKSRRNDKR